MNPLDFADPVNALVTEMIARRTRPRTLGLSLLVEAVALLRTGGRTDESIIATLETVLDVLRSK